MSLLDWFEWDLTVSQIERCQQIIEIGSPGMSLFQSSLKLAYIISSLVVPDVSSWDLSLLKLEIGSNQSGLGLNTFECKNDQLMYPSQSIDS
jgi:hypothetical protein